MGQLTSIAPVADAGRLIVNPHPVLLDGRTNVPCDLQPGETLYAFLSRHVDLSEQWEVRIGGEVVPVEHWMRVKPKHGQVIEVVHAVNRQALYLVAMIALTYFTFGAGTTAGAALFGAGTTAAAVTNMAVYVAGSILINKVLGPKQPEPVAEKSRDSVYSINSARNQMRPYDPVGLLFGHTRITPDLASMPYIWHEGDDQYLGMVLNVGANVHDVGDIYHGDGLLSAFDGVQVYYNNIPGKSNQTIPLYSNADTIEGGELEKTTAWVQRTTPPETVRIQLNIEGTIGDRTSKGKDYYNQETIQAEYRPVGSATWQPLVSRVISNANGKNFEIQRVTLSRDVAEGQYDVRVRRLYTAQDVDKGDQYWSAQTQFQWTTMVAVQSDDATYAGMGRIGIRVRATGQLSGALDQLRMEAWSRPIPVWNGTVWVTEATSNPGALILQFLRGVHDENGRIIAGLGLDEDEIDIPSLQAFMVHCAAEGYQYNHYLRDVRNNGDQLEAMARAGFGAMSWESGRWGVVWAADGQPVSGVVNMATIKRGQFQVDYTLAQAADGIEYTYLDSSDWQVKTIRVPAPGVDTMLNPATVQAEGVSTEAHAAQMARWHLAQSLYQYKDIVFSTDLEHLAYKRMDVLQLQHDLTQWGYGGRLVSVDGDVLTLDEPVPGNSVAWIGIRIPGESVYRTLRVQAFEGESDTITLMDSWPSDAPLPANPAHDYIWIYDFKATPGYRVRVVGKELESDAKGASVAVVPEGPEFWNYVKTGEYIPPQPGSLLDTRPKASNVKVSEVQVVTGDVVHTELAVTFDLSGPAARTVIFAGLQGSEIGPVAETVTQTARFRIGSAGTYTIVVRPYSADGIAGESATVTYTTEGADIPPPPFDWVSVTVEPAGLRRYAWGYYQFQPADLAGAEIRFMPGTVADPDWDDMTPLGADGFFTAAFESDVPVAGDWTFAFAAINTAGDLSAPVITHETLTDNVGEHLEDHGDRIEHTEQELIDQQAAIDQEVADRIAEDLRIAGEAAADAQAKANAALATAMASVNALEAQVADIVGAPDWDPLETYEPDQMVKFDGGLYRALVQTTGDQPDTSPAEWEKVGDYDSMGEAVAAALTLATQTASELEAEVTRINALYARMPSGTDGLATEAMVADEAQARADADSALGERISITQASIGQTVLLNNPDFELAEAGWQENAYTIDNPNAPLPSNVSIYTGDSGLVHTGARSLRVLPPASSTVTRVYNSNRFSAGPDDVVSGSIRMRTHYSSPPPAGTRVYLGVRWYGPTNDFVADRALGEHTFGGSGNYFFGNPPLAGEATAPTGTAYGRFYIHVSAEFHGAPGALYFDAAQARKGSVSASASDLSLVQAEVTQQGNTLTAHTQRLDAQETDIAGKASASDLSLVQTTVTQQGNTLTTHASRLDSQQTAIDGKASTSYVNSVEGIATAAGSAASDAQSAAQAASNLAGSKGKVIVQSSAPAAADRQPQNLWIDTTGGANTPKRWVSGSTWAAVTDKAATDAAAAATAAQATANSAASQASANLTAITGLNATVGGISSSINELREVSVSAAAGNAIVNASFEKTGTGQGWGATSDGTGSFNGYYFATAAARSGGHVFRFNAAVNLNNAGLMAVPASRQIRVGFHSRHVGGVAPTSYIRFTVRGYDAQMNQVLYTAVGGSATRAGGGAYDTTYRKNERVYTVPSDVVFIRAVLQTTTGDWTGNWMVDDVFMEPVSELDATMMARHTVALDVNGHVSGTVSENDGESSSFSILATVFRVISGPTAGLEWQNGYLRAYALGAQIVLGSNFGSGSDLMLWCGPNVGANNCTKANGLFWVDNTGDGYFAGRVLQGVLRWFNSTTSTSSTASVTTGNNPRLGKQVSLSLRYQYQQRYRYRGAGASVSPGNGQTAVTVHIERRYGSGTWAELATQEVMGQGIPYNGEPGENLAIWTNVIDGTLFATDTASTSNSEYRARISGRTTQAHSGTGTADPVQTSQYLSIEAME